MAAGSNIEQALVARFLDLYLEDQARGSIQSDEAYLELFPAAREAVAVELRALREETKNSPDSEADSEEAAPDILIRLEADRASGVERTFSEYLALFPGREREVATALGHLEPEESAQAPAEMPETLGPFRLERELGRGGQATVYLAQDDKLGRKIALKVFVTSALLPDSSTRQRFEREAQVAARLDHPNLCTVYDVGEEGPFAYIAMPYVEGESLAARLARHKERVEEGAVLGLAPGAEGNGRDSMRQGDAVMSIVAMIEQLARAAHVAHEAGVLHRDIKPSNVILTPDGRPVLLDFGLAHTAEEDGEPGLTRTGDVLGTPRYMSPEQVDGTGLSLDRRTDVYSLAVTLFECLTGRPPFDAKSLQSLYRQILTKDPPRARRLQPAVPEDLDVILQVALEKDPWRRFGSALELADDLGRLRRNEPIRATKASTAYQVRKFAQRHRGLVAGLVATVCALILGTVVAVNFALRSRAAEDRVSASEAEARQIAYRALLQTGKVASDAGNYVAALAAVEEADETLRGWEWQHHLAHIHESVATVASGIDFMPAIGFDESGRPLTVRASGPGADVIDVGSGEVLSSLGPVAYSYWFSEDAELVAAFFRNEKGVVYEVATGREVMSIPIPTLVTGVEAAVVTDSTLVILIDRSMRVFDVPSGSLRFRRDPTPMENPPGGLLNISGPVAMSSDGAYIAHVFRDAGSPTYLELLDGSSGRVLKRRELSGRYPHAVGISADGSRVATVGLRLEQFTVPDLAHAVDVVHMGVDPPGSGAAHERGSLTYTAEGRLVLTQDREEVLLFDASTGRFRMNLRAPFQVNRARLNVLEGVALLASTDEVRGHDVQLLAMGQTAVRVLTGHQTYVYTAAFSPDGALLATGDFRGGVRLWDPVGGQMLAELALGEGSASPVDQLWFSADGANLVAQGAGAESACVWDLFTGQLKQGVAGTLPVPSGGALLSSGTGVRQAPGEPAALARDGEFRVVGRSSGEVVVVEEDGSAVGQELASFEAHSGQVSAVGVSHDGQWVATGGRRDGTVSIWSADAGEERASLLLQKGGAEIFSVDFHPDGSRLAAAGRDGVIRLLDTSTFKLAAKLEGHTSYVHCVAFSPDGTLLASASGDRTVRLWDTVSPYRRRQEARGAEMLRAALRPRVEQAFEELGDSAATELLREPLSEEDRVALRHLCLERAFSQ